MLLQVILPCYLIIISAVCKHVTNENRHFFIENFLNCADFYSVTAFWSARLYITEHFFMHCMSTRNVPTVFGVKTAFSLYFDTVLLKPPVNDIVTICR